MLEPTELRRLSQLSSTRTTAALFLDAVLVVLIFLFAARFPNPLTYLAAFILIGRTQLALAILMHDGAHRRLYKSHKLNDWVGQFACAAPLFFAMDSYKKLHLKHHLNPLVEDDPDISLIGGYPINRKSFYRKIFRDLSGISYFKFIGYFIYRGRARSKKGETSRAQPQKSSKPSSPSLAVGPSKTWIALSIVLAQGMILGLLWAFGHPWLYLGLWVLPFMTILQFLLRIRGIAEHAGYQPNRNQALNARTVINPVQTFFFAPHGVNYHIEHHLYPSIPFYRLPEAHRLLKERGVLPESNLYRGYGKIIAELVR